MRRGCELDGSSGDSGSQFLRELHFIEAKHTDALLLWFRSQFLRELHFIEAGCMTPTASRGAMSQFLRELHFIEACRGRRQVP